MSDTPETDAELNLYLRHGEAHQVSVPWIEFARKLERERDEAREAIREAWLAMDETGGTDRMINWQNKHANILEATK